MLTGSVLQIPDGKTKTGELSECSPVLYVMIKRAVLPAEISF